MSQSTESEIEGVLADERDPDRGMIERARSYLMCLNRWLKGEFQPIRPRRQGPVPGRRGGAADRRSFAAGSMSRRSKDDGTTAVIELTYENLLVDLFREGSLRYTHAQQQARFPGDKVLAYVTAMAQKNLVCGGKS